jgi:hypothetical protein
VRRGTLLGAWGGSSAYWGLGSEKLGPRPGIHRQPAALAAADDRAAAARPGRGRPGRRPGHIPERPARNPGTVKAADCVSSPAQ